MMQDNIFLRNDTILGVCEALGEDFGFNPNYLRVALILPLFWLPVQMLALYLGLGVVVMISRLLFPAAKPVEATSADVAPLPTKVAQVEGQAALPKAA